MVEYRTVRGINLAFEWIDHGGELIVFLHGVGADRTSWEPQVDFFSELGYSVAAIDMRGSGASQSRDENGLALPITIADFAADVHELILALGFERAHWVGNSMGGVIIMEAFRQQFSTIAKAVLANTFAKYPDSHLILPRPANALKTKSLAEFAAERIPFAHRPDIAPEILEASIRAMVAKDVETYLLSWRETWSHDYRSQLPLLTKERGRGEVLVITGSLDKITPPTLGIEIANLIPDAEYHLIENAGHLSNLDQPDKFNRVVWEFLKKS
jgi:3-oxoadipate enol-lactonase